MTLSRRVHKYLAHYAEPEARLALRLPQTFDHCLVIPAYQESLTSLMNVWRNIDNTLIILVVNAPDAADAQTSQLLDDIRANWQVTHIDENIQFCSTTEGTQVLVVDRCTRPIPIREGVGRARKIGCDIACTLIAEQTVRSAWICCTDADATLPDDYTSPMEHISPDVSAIIYPFNHRAEPGLEDASALYEFSLLYYAAGLQFAGSAYAYPSVGSTICINYNNYTQVRGYPPRPAGEDFYILNKLAKTGPIEQLSTPVISLSGRLSQRVPFGTGVGIRKIAGLDQPIEQYTFYHPACFVHLKQLLSRLRTSYQAADIAAHIAQPVHRAFLEKAGLTKQLSAKKHLPEPVYQKFLTDWLDGFRTLKFIHYIRDSGLKNVPFDQLWETPLLPSSPMRIPEACQELRARLANVPLNKGS